jgi:peptidoglycan DL-endopeptidase LytF
VDAAYRRITVLLVLALLLPACTRERPAPDPTATPALAGAPPTAIVIEDSAPPPPGQEPEVDAIAPDTPEADATPTQQSDQQTFQYTVQPGDTLLSIAIKYETDVETIRELNALESDNIGVGQPLYLPYVEGMTIEGLPTPTPGPFAYTIRPGDTLNGIAVRFGVDAIAIIETNNLLTPDNLTVGAVIIIPNYQPPSTAGSDDTSPPPGVVVPVTGDDQVIHVVQPGEGLFEIAGLYGIAPTDIAAANNLDNQNLLRVGQELIIPGVSRREVLARQGTVHVVQAGESMLGIAIRYGVTVEEILDANELVDPDALFEGQELIIPRN